MDDEEDTRYSISVAAKGILEHLRTWRDGVQTKREAKKSIKQNLDYIKRVLE